MSTSSRFGSLLARHRAPQRPGAASTCAKVNSAYYNAAVTTLSASSEIRSMCLNMQGIHDALSAVKSIHRHVSTEGWSRPIAALAAGMGLYDAIPLLPSAESLSFVPDRESKKAIRGTTALEGLAGQEEATVTAFIAEVAAALAQAIDGMQRQVDESRDALTDQKETIEGAEPPDALLTQTSLLTMSATGLSKALGQLTEAFADMEVPEYNASSADLSSVREIVSSMVEKLAPFTGAQFNAETCLITVTPTSVDEDYVATEGTLSDKGYTGELTSGILTRALELLDAVAQFTAKKSAIIEALKAAKEQSESTTGDGDSAEKAAAESLRVLMGDDPVTSVQTGEPEMDDDPVPPNGDDDLQKDPEVQPSVELSGIHRQVISAYGMLVAVMGDAMTRLLGNAIQVGEAIAAGISPEKSEGSDDLDPTNNDDAAA